MTIGNSIGNITNINISSLQSRESLASLKTEPSFKLPNSNFSVPSFFNGVSANNDISYFLTQDPIAQDLFKDLEVNVNSLKSLTSLYRPDVISYKLPYSTGLLGYSNSLVKANDDIIEPHPQRKTGGAS